MQNRKKVVNLSLSNGQHLLAVHRKSIIGSRLERSSFQDQRLSDVGVAFGQQITAKVGLKLPASQERIIEQTRWLYLRYIFVKLRQHGLPSRDLNLTKSSRQRRAALSNKTPSNERLPRISTPSIRLPSREPSRQSFVVKKTSNHLYPKLKTDIRRRGSNFPAMKSNEINCNLNESCSINSPVSMVANNNNRKFVMDPTINNQIFNVIWSIIRELREAKPELYADTVYELIGLDKFSTLQSLLNIQLTICQEMIRSDISWCRIAALFSLFGAMSLDCVRLGAPEHVGPILDGFIEFVERDLALWISQQGGWESFLYKYRSGHRLRNLASNLFILIIPITALILCLQCKDIIYF